MVDLDYQKMYEDLLSVIGINSFVPTHRHYKGGLYREVGRGHATMYDVYDEGELVAAYERQYHGGIELTPTAVAHRRAFFIASAIVTDELFGSEPFVLYQHSSGNHYVRPARLFDEPTRFVRLSLASEQERGEPRPVVNIMDALRQSIEAEKES